MRAISLFSGAGGFELGLERAGVQTVLQAECDPWCLQVLERHWPDCERVDDVRSVDNPLLQQLGDAQQRRGAGSLRNGHGAVAGLDRGVRDASGWDIDLVYGGFPCQDVSVAGARAGFSGQRSSLWFEFERVLRELRPRWALIENVSGLLSSGSRPGADFGVVLRGLVELGYGVAWRTLDARWFGVPQRRRRVFLVGCAGDAQRAAQVLAVCESCGGHPSESQEAGQDVAPTLDDGARRASVELPMIAFHSKDHGQDVSYDLSPTVRAAENENGGTPPAVMLPTLAPGAHPGGLTGREAENGNYVVASAVRASDGHHGHSSGRGDGGDNLVVADPISAHEGKTYTHEGKNNFRTHNVVAFDWQQAGDDRYRPVRAGDYSGSLSDTRVDAVAGDFGVRRLTPLECERLMGWPDQHTRWTADGKEISDSHRYRLCGNGVVAPVAEWLGHRLIAADAW